MERPMFLFTDPSLFSCFDILSHTHLHFRVEECSAFPFSPQEEEINTAFKLFLAIILFRCLFYCTRFPSTDFHAV